MNDNTIAITVEGRTLCVRVPDHPKLSALVNKYEGVKGRGDWKGFWLFYASDKEAIRKELRRIYGSAVPLTGAS